MLPEFPDRSILPRICVRHCVLLAVVSVLLVTSSGCTSVRDYVNNGFKVGPNYQKPPAPVAEQWIDSKSKGVNVVTKDLSEWWTVFRDPALDSLIREAYRQNLDVRTAGTRILAARAQRGIAVGSLFPQTQQAFADVSRDAISGNKANLPPGITRFFDRNDAGFNLSWELDFWGRFRRGIESANAELDASIENYDDALVLMISEVAANYVQLRVYQQRLRYIAKNIEIQTKLAKDAEGRLKGGVGAAIDQAQMRSNLSNTLALKEQFEIGVRVANNRLCELLGIPMRDLVPMLGDGNIPTPPPEAGVGMPADLLRRRPDVRRAERLVAAQSARIGIATADLYPRIGLIGVIGYESKNFSELFSPGSLQGSIGPSVRWDILNYGRILNGIRVQDALFQTRVLDYQSAVLHAGREAEDGIVRFLRAQTQARNLFQSANEAQIAAEEAVRLSDNVKFDINRLFVTTNFLVGQQDQLAQAQGDIALGLIQIYKALGGGWEIRLSPEANNGLPAPAPRRHGILRPQVHLMAPVSN